MATATLSNSWDTLGDWADVALNYGVAFGEVVHEGVSTVYGDVVAKPLGALTNSLDDLSEGSKTLLTWLPITLAVVAILALLFYLKGAK